jgi:NAD(P)-dependent dehydrogenase (short-subunit alcohol dehydrogenase family)
VHRTWLVTGAASGIGREIASQIARRGENLVLWDKNGEELERVASLLGPSVLHREEVDVTSPDGVREAAQRAANLSFAITRTLHCAGILRTGPALALTPSDYRAMMEVNFLGTVNVARALAPVLIQSGRKRDKSILGLVASVAGLRGIPTLAGYSASKFAVVGFAQALRDELHDEPINVRVICPPAVDTPMVQNLEELPPVYRLSPPQPVDKVVTALLSQVERSEFLSLLDVSTKVMWGVQRALPAGLDWALRRAAKK